MKISTVNNSSILTHYYAVILDYEDIFPLSKRFRLIVRDQEIGVLICDTLFVSQELAREYFYKYYGKRALKAESSISEEVSPNDVQWSQCDSFEYILKRIFRAIQLCLERLEELSTEKKTDSFKGVNVYDAIYTDHLSAPKIH